MQSPSLCRIRGEIVAIAMPKDPLPTDILTVTFRELTVKGVRVYAPYDFERAIRIVAESGIDFGRLLSKPFALTDAAEAFDVAKEGRDVMRVLIEI